MTAPVKTRMDATSALMEAQGYLVLAANLSRGEGAPQTARAALAACELVVEITADHTKRSG